ncbi:hypothetical protein WN943_017342 [Citrus x changshan-huyou]
MVLGSVCLPLLTHSPPVSPPPPIALPFSTCHHSLNQSKEQTKPNKKLLSLLSLSLSLFITSQHFPYHSIQIHLSESRTIYLFNFFFLVIALMDLPNFFTRSVIFTLFLFLLFSFPFFIIIIIIIIIIMCIFRSLRVNRLKLLAL